MRNEINNLYGAAREGFKDSFKLFGSIILAIITIVSAFMSHDAASKPAHASLNRNATKHPRI